MCVWPDEEHVLLRWCQQFHACGVLTTHLSPAYPCLANLLKGGSINIFFKGLVNVLWTNWSLLNAPTYKTDTYYTRTLYKAFQNERKQIETCTVRVYGGEGVGWV